MGAHVQLFTTLSTTQIRWRLLSGNNREVGRGAAAYPDVDAAVAAIRQSQVMITEFNRRVRRVTSNHWRWELLCSDIAHIASGHPFDRQIRCEQGLEQFLSLFVAAPIGDAVMVSGSRRGR